MNRVFPKESHPMAERATGQWFSTPAGLMQRYEEAPSPQGRAHWYLHDQQHNEGWRVFLESQVKPYVPTAKRLRQRKLKA
jgi:hypothetical protein